MPLGLDQQYFAWLYARTGLNDSGPASLRYSKLCKKLYDKEFVWLIANDDNRVEDGRDLRFVFIDEMHIQNAEASWMRLGCSVLELLVALCERLTFQTDIPVADWFLELLDNLNLSHMNDAYIRTKKHWEIIEDHLDIFIQRTYAPNGRGGLFPLEDPYDDQREVEIWYQASAYLLEKF